MSQRQTLSGGNSGSGLANSSSGNSSSGNSSSGNSSNAVSFNDGSAHRCSTKNTHAGDSSGSMPENPSRSAGSGFFGASQKHLFWEHHIKRCSMGRLSQQAYCEKHKLKLHQFKYWKRRLLSGKEKNEVTFLPVTMPDTSCAPCLAGRVRILAPNGFAVEMESPVSLSELLALVADL